MLLKITRKCSMGCSHCLEDATIDGKHMDMKTFEKVLSFLKQLNPFCILITGGEPIEHPDFFTIMERLISVFGKERLLITTNGLFLYDQNFTDKVLNLGVKLQVTNDIRYYPMQINMNVQHNLIAYETKIRTIYPQGRAVVNNIKASDFKSPKCFNIRSVAIRNANTFKEAVSILEGMGKFCSPSIGVDGDIFLGESSLCSKVGTIKMNDNELLESIKNFKCNKCGLVSKLPPTYRAIINE